MHVQETSMSSSATTNAHAAANGCTSSMEQLRQLQAVSTTVLHQAVDLVDNVLCEDEQLLVHSLYLPGSTIGKHLRHARDHFMALLECMATPGPHVFSYDSRKRDTPMETNLSAARQCLKETIALLEDRVQTIPLDEPLTLDAITPYKQSVQSTFGRELWFCGLHAVHHWAMVRVIAGEMGIKLDDSFGFAPSTLVHQGNDGLLAKAKI